MSLQFIIDGYNIINHPIFLHYSTKKSKDSHAMLLEFIRRNRLCGSSRNKVTVVFDGHPSCRSERLERVDIDIVFSRQESADERIKKILEAADKPKNIIVVSDDKEIKLFVNYKGARWLGVEEFVQRRIKKQGVVEEAIKPELTYSQMHKINQELKKIWLK